MIGPADTAPGEAHRPGEFSALIGIGLLVLGHQRAGEWDSHLADKIQPPASDPHPEVGTERPG